MSSLRDPLSCRSVSGCRWVATQTLGAREEREALPYSPSNACTPWRASPEQLPISRAKTLAKYARVMGFGHSTFGRAQPYYRMSGQVRGRGISLAERAGCSLRDDIGAGYATSDPYAEVDISVFRNWCPTKWHEILTGGSFYLLRGNDSQVLRDAALDHLGIALLPTWLIGEHLRSGRLEAALANWESLMAPGPERAIWAVYPPKKVIPPKTRSSSISWRAVLGVRHTGSPPDGDVALAVGRGQSVGSARQVDRAPQHMPTALPMPPLEKTSQSEPNNAPPRTSLRHSQLGKLASSENHHQRGLSVGQSLRSNSIVTVR